MLALLHRRPVVLVALLAAAVAAAAGRWAGYVDLAVYRHGAATVLDRGDLYATTPPGSGLLFTYPPFAALSFTPLALAPRGLAIALLTAAGVLALAGTLWLVAAQGGRRWSPRLTALACLAALTLEPVRETLQFGQVNLVLMGLIACDLLVLRGRWSGVLIGIAAGIKLTPLVFVVLLVVVGRRAAACRAVSTFAATVLLGVVLVPHDAARFWGAAMWDTDRVGRQEYWRNQALTSVLASPTWLWLLVAGTTGAVAIALAAWWWRRGAHDVALLLGAVAMLVCSPIAWDHHWVWAAPAVVVLARRAPWPVDRGGRGPRPGRPGRAQLPRGGAGAARRAGRIRGAHRGEPAASAHPLPGAVDRPPHRVDQRVDRCLGDDPERRLAVERGLDPRRERRSAGQPESQLRTGDLVGRGQPAVARLDVRQHHDDVLDAGGLGGRHDPARVAGRVVGVAQADLVRRHVEPAPYGERGRAGQLTRAAGDHHGQGSVVLDRGQVGVEDDRGGDPRVVGPRRERHVEQGEVGVVHPSNVTTAPAPARGPARSAWCWVAQPILTTWVPPANLSNQCWRLTGSLLMPTTIRITAATERQAAEDGPTIGTMPRMLERP